MLKSSVFQEYKGHVLMFILFCKQQCKSIYVGASVCIAFLNLSALSQKEKAFGKK